MTDFRRGFVFRLSTALLTVATIPISASIFDLPDGGAGFKLLKIDASPASLALSGAGVGSVSEDPVRNPATDSVGKTTLTAGYGRSFSKMDGSLQQATWAVPDGRFTWNAIARFQGFEDIPGRDGDDRSTGTYGASSWALDAGLSSSTSIPGLRAGATLGAGMNAVSEASAWGAWMSFGVVFQPDSSRWSLGASIRNLGAGTTSGDHSEQLPLIAQAGATWHQALGNWTLIPMADIKMVADEELQFPIALEARWNIISFRTGYVLGRDEFLPSLGLGLEWDSWLLDAGTAWHGALGFAPAARLGVRF